MYTILEYFFIGGCCLLAIAALWLIANGWRRQWRNQWSPVLVGLLGIAAVAFPAAYTRIVENIDLGPREKYVDGELHLTLTGWDQHNYMVLSHRPQTVVLQMANPDVTDETLKLLNGMTKLRELDLNDTQVTDRGLSELSKLPTLEILRLRGTKITDAGFREHLLEHAGLQRLELSQTEVSSDLIADWKSRKSGRRVIR